MADFTARQILSLKLETTYGVDAAPSHLSSGDTIRLLDAPTVDLGSEILEFSGGNFTRGRIRPIQTVRPFGVTFRAYVQGTDATTFTANVKPPLTNAIQCCGAQEEYVSAQAAYTYKPTADVSSDKSASLIINVDGVEHKAVGCRGNFNFIYAAAAPVIAEFNLRGILLTEVTTTRGTPVGLPQATPQRWIGSGTIIVGSVMANMENCNFNCGNTVFEERSSNASSASGIGVVYLTARAPGGSFDPEATDSMDTVGIYRSSSGSILQLAIGTQQGLRFTITASQIVPKTLARADKSGLVVWNEAFEAYERNGDDNWMLSFQ